MDKQALLDFAETLELNQTAFVPMDSISFYQEIRGLCSANSCGKYATNWQCPPGVGEVEQLARRAQGYSHALLFNLVHPLEDSFDYEGMMEGRKRLRDKEEQLRQKLEEWGTEDYWLMGSGGCDLCEECTYPSGPCRFPKRALSPIEACGINVMELSQRSGFQYINGQNTVTYFGLLLW